MRVDVRKKSGLKIPIQKLGGSYWKSERHRLDPWALVQNLRSWSGDR